MAPGSSTSTAPTTVIVPTSSVWAHLVQLWHYRELLVALVRKELKVKYKNSTLGFFWTTLNPMLTLCVYFFVFSVLLGNGIPRFPVWLLCGLLVWNLFSNSMVSATGSITGNGSLVNKVAFPREILPLASVGANLVHFFFQAIVLLGALIAFQRSVAVEYIWLIVPAMLVVLVLAGALSVFLSAINVYARDTQHLLELVVMVWFWLTPIVYPWAQVATKLKENGMPSWLTLLNPITSIVITFQRAIYAQPTYTTTSTGADGVKVVTVNQLLPLEGPWWYLRNLSIVGLVAVVLFIGALRFFTRVEGNFAEEI